MTAMFIALWCLGILVNAAIVTAVWQEFSSMPGHGRVHTVVVVALVLLSWVTWLYIIIRMLCDGVGKR